MKFEIVPEARRESKLGPLAKALLAGNTILVPLGSHTAGAYSTLKRHGYKLRQHRSDDGLVLWAEKNGAAE